MTRPVRLASGSPMSVATSFVPWTEWPNSMRCAAAPAGKAIEPASAARIAAATKNFRIALTVELYGLMPGERHERTCLASEYNDCEQHGAVPGPETHLP